MMNRIFAAVFLVALVFSSLLTFPSALPWLALTWVILALVAHLRDRRMWPWLVTFVVILTIKRPGFSGEYLFLAIGFLLVGFLDWRRAIGGSQSRDAKPMNRGWTALSLLFLIVPTATFGIMRWYGANTSRRLVADKRPVACLGDSLTDCGYPQELEKLIAVPVADFGVDGITTDDGIKMIPEILAADPQLVIIELGGHDYNSGNKTRSETKANLARLIETFQQNNIAVILVEIPRGFITDPFDGLERELTTKYDVQLIDDSLIRRFVFFSPIMPPGMWLDPNQRYSDDGLHPNQRGNRLFARVVRDSLVKIFGQSILN